MDRVEITAIKLNEDYCSKCSICASGCPFEAISVDKDAGRVKIDIEKCQVCGICASSCPASAIELTYYDDKSLIEYVERQEEALKTENLVIMCRASSPPSCEILDILKEQKVDKFIPLRLPCVGRLPAELYLKALTNGIRKMVVVQCDENSCRFKKGSSINTRKVLLLQTLLRQLNYENKVITVVENPSKAVYDTAKCVGCDKCEFICPYDAIEAQPLATPQINLKACKGCGACALVCPHLAIQLKGFEYEISSQAIHKYKIEADKIRAKGISPLILVFCCQWAEFSALDHVRNGFTRENAILVEIPCFDGLDPVQVLEAFRSGFDGVLAIVCPDEDCKLKEGRDTAERNAAALQKVLEKLNLADRFEMHKTSPRYIGDFDSKLDSFLAKISSLPKMTPGEVIDYV